MNVTLFGAGLGDVIRSIYLRASYKLLSEALEPTAVIVASHNPYSVEIFRHHTNNSQFVIFDLGHKYIEFTSKGLDGQKVIESLVSFAGQSMDRLVLGTSGGYNPVFYAPDEVDSSGHIVFCPFAGSVGARTFEDSFTQGVLDVLKRSGRKIFLISRDFTRRDSRGNIIHAGENAGAFAQDGVIWLDNLSVPASINLVKNAAAYVGSWSSLQQAAWFANKPVAVFYPPNWGDVTKRTGYAFGLDRPDCHHSDFLKFSKEDFSDWLSSLPAM